MFRQSLRLATLILVVVVPPALMVMAEPAAPITNAGWAELGTGSASGGGISHMGSPYGMWPSLAVDSERLPVIAWQDGYYFHEIFVRRWNGTAWVEMGAGSGTGGGISYNDTDSDKPSLAIGPDDRPIVAWEDGENESKPEIFVRRWNGTAWVEMGQNSATLGGISNTATGSWMPSLAIGADGTPIVAWVEGEVEWEPNEIYVRRWNGSTWVELGEGSASGGGISNTAAGSSWPSLAIGDDGAPIIAWTEIDLNESGEIFVRRWNGASWAELGAGSATGGGISNTAGHSRVPFLAIGGDGTPIVAWEGQNDIFIRRWNGTAWVEIGAGSASGGGISHTTIASWAPALAMDDDGAPVVAWFDGGSTKAEIYVRRWNGTAWVVASPGSAAGGGVSETLGYSAEPSLAVGLNGAPIVAWSEARYLEGHWAFVRYWPLRTHRVYSPLSLSPQFPPARSAAR